MKTLKAVFVLLSVIIISGCASVPFAGKKVRYVEVHSRSCYVCQRMEKVIDELDSKYGSQVEIDSYSDSSDEGGEYVEKYKITKFPANIMLDATGAVFFRYDGLLDVKALETQFFKKGVTPPPDAGTAVK